MHLPARRNGTNFGTNSVTDPNMKYDIIIIGAGAAGLVAMKQLLAYGYSVCLLEADNKAGGRMRTIREGFSTPTEAGAEFVHGRLPITRQLLKEANISYEEVGGKMIYVEQGKWLEEQED